MSTQFRGSRIAMLLSGLASAGCQVYDFQPVQPNAFYQSAHAEVATAATGSGLRPDLMFVVDRSGSMQDQPDNTPTTDPNDPRSKINILKSTMNSFIGANPTLARMGVTFFTVDGSACNAPTVASISSVGANIPNSDVDADLAAASAKVNSIVQGLTPNGATPTAASLRMLNTYPPLVNDTGRQRFVVLMTDGLPNCLGGDPSLDDPQGPVDAANLLRQSGISTIVIGFGTDANTGTAAQTLNNIAAAGGFIRDCKTDADCGGDPNDPCQIPAGATVGTCAKKYYSATTGAKLAAALASIGGSVGPKLGCIYSLTPVPSDPNLLSVSVNGTDVPRGPTTWSYSAGQVIFAPDGTVCKELQNASRTSPVNVEFRTLTTL